MIPIFNARALGKRYRVADISEEPTVEQLEWLRGRGVDALEVRPTRGSRRIFHMDWVEDLEAVRFVNIVSSRPIGPMPVNTARRLEVLWVYGRLKSSFDLGQARHLRSLSIAADLLHGSLAQVPELVHCGLSRMKTLSSTIFEDCHSLKSAYLEPDHRLPSAVWDFRMQGSSPIEELTLMKIGIQSLEGISALVDLAELVVAPREDVGLDHRLDLSPLAACSQLRKIVLHRSGILTNAQVLDELPNLEKVTVAQGGLEPDLGDRDWLSVL